LPKLSPLPRHSSADRFARKSSNNDRNSWTISKSSQACSPAIVGPAMGGGFGRALGGDATAGRIVSLFLASRNSANSGARCAKLRSKRRILEESPDCSALIYPLCCHVRSSKAESRAQTSIVCPSANPADFQCPDRRSHGCL
jgi:hypothetical protein